MMTPGNYFIELAFKRPVDESTLALALHKMGFTNIEFDKNDDVAVGALALTAAYAAVAKPIAAAKVVAVPTKTTSTVSSTLAAVSAAAPKPVVVTAALPVKPPVTNYSQGSYATTPVASATTAKAATKTTSTVAKTVAAVDSLRASTAATPGYGAAPVAAVPSKGAAVPTAKTPEKAEPPPLSYSDEPKPHSYTKERVDEPAPDGGSARSDVAANNNFASKPPDPYLQAMEEAEAAYQKTIATAASVAPQESEAPPSVQPSAVTLSPEHALLQRMNQEMGKTMSTPIAERWKRWVEWGSPFATSPAHLVNVSGEEEANITRFRFVATLVNSFTPSNLPDMSWVLIRRLAINPFADLTFQLKPYKLSRGGLYEFRFFSRMKSNPTKESVKRTLMEMGFSPMKLILLKKNMRIPRRGNVSVCLWMGVGRWSAPTSLTTTEDPFFFESLKEVQK